MTKNSVVPISSRLPSFPKLEEFGGVLDSHHYESEGGGVFSSEVDEYTRLIPRADLEPLLVEIDRSLEPASRDQSAVAAAKLIGAYRKADLESPEIFTQLLLEDMADYPADILEETVREIRRTCKFFPTIAEVVLVASKLMGKRRQRRRVAQAMMAEHRRREERARKEREAEEKEAQRIKDRYAALTKVYGAEAVPPEEDLAPAEQAVLRCMGYRELVKWNAALERGEQWALQVWRRMGIMGAVLPRGRAFSANTISERQAADLLELTGTDYAAAREFVRQGAIDRNQKPGISDPDAYAKEDAERGLQGLTVIYEDIDRAMAQVIRDLQAAEQPARSSDDLQLAIDQLRAEGGTTKDIEEFITSVFDDAPGSAERMRALAAASRAKVA